MTESTGWIDLEHLAGRVRASEDSVVLEDHRIPRVLEIVTDFGGEPETYARVEVSEAGAKLVELRFSSVDPDARGIRQSDLRDLQVGALLEDFVAIWTVRMVRDESGAVTEVRNSLEPRDFVEHVRFVGRMRSGRTSRDITPQLLERVAKVYRDNISGHPNKAVEHHFQVGQRMAAEYVSRARKRGLLPPTKKGQKKA